MLNRNNSMNCGDNPLKEIGKYKKSKVYVVCEDNLDLKKVNYAALKKNAVVDTSYNDGGTTVYKDENYYLTECHNYDKKNACNDIIISSKFYGTHYCCNKNA